MKLSSLIKRILIIFIIIIVAGYAVALCIYESLDWAQTALPNHLKTMSKEELLDDYDYLCNSIREYNTSVALEYDSKELEDIFAANRTKIAEYSEYPAYTFAESIDQLFSDLGSVSSVNTLSLYGEKVLLSVYNNPRIVEDSKIPDFREMISEDVIKTSAWNTARQITNKFDIDIRNLDYKELKKLEGDPDYKKKIEQYIPTDPSALVPVLTDAENGIACAKIRSFQPESTENDKELLTAWYEKNKNAKAFIFDLRDNIGGTDYYWLLDIVPYFLNEEVSFSSHVFINELPEYVDKASFDDRFTKCGDDQKAEFAKALSADKSPALSDVDLYERINTVKPSEKCALGISSDLYVLVNENTKNAAAAFAYFCKMTGFATVIGSETAPDSGAGASMTPMVFVLPNSKLAYTMTIGLAVNSEGLNDQKRGIAPHIDTAGTDAYQYCVNYINK